MTRQKSPGRQANNSKKTKKNQPKRMRGWLRILLKLSVVALLILAVVMVYLDAVVQERFSGKRWTVPARVYARPLELYVGEKLAQEDFLIELSALGYQRERNAERVGTYSLNANTIEFHSRGFQFYEGAESAQRVRVSFGGGKVTKLTNAQGQPIAVVRIEPMLIGGLYPAHKEDRILVRIDQVPELLIQTLVVVEDREFYQHWGVSPKSIARAVWVNASAGGMRQGGSTLTQQLVKNFFLTPERSLKRKATEALMSLLLEIHYDKDEILEAYLNEVFLGQDGERAIHGFGLASQYFFSQPLAELQVHQVALLVGMVKGPSFYNPRRQPERALERRNLVIDLLTSQAVISPEEAELAKKRPLGISEKGSLANTTYPAFLDLVKRQLREDYRDQDLTEEGLRIFTSLDPILQRKAEDALQRTFKDLSWRKGIEDIETAMVVTHPETGEVQALLGSRQPRFAGFNRALDAVRPIGSLVKPAIYLTALQQPEKYTLTSYLQDEAFSVQDAKGRVWSPQNYDRKEHGTIFLYQGLAFSHNLSSAKLGLDLGLPKVLNTLKGLGLQRDWPAYPSMLLGAGGMTPFEVTNLYQTLANGGFNSSLRAIRSVLDAEGEPLGRYPLQVEQRFDAGAIYLTQEALRRTMTEGTGRSAYNKLPKNLRVAGKTGTSNDLRDSWFAGYGQDILAVAWMGRDDNGQTSLTGASGALQLWTNFMQQARPTSLSQVPPDNVVDVLIDPVQGFSVSHGCAGVVKMPYLKGSEPPLGNFCGELDEPPVEKAKKESEGGFKDWVKGWLSR